MESILEHLFQGDIIFPQSPEMEHQFAVLSEEVQEKKRRMEQALDETCVQAVSAYLEHLERFHDWERLLCYENGFLTAAVFCREILDRWERLKL